MDLADPLDGGKQFVHDALGLVALGGQSKGWAGSARMPAPCWTTQRSRIRWLGRTSIT
ncbi:hypothetical protein [Streptomyces sp. 2224.1]|uniref:hypothetical protein n=1 Tax=Streptomyces sp. 2224.1 TaxID=1881020 RepID=UPI0015A4C4D2|nr:hypothetical protein [Streptomyces sp. 2224.1]